MTGSRFKWDTRLALMAAAHAAATARERRAHRELAWYRAAANHWRHWFGVACDLEAARQGEDMPTTERAEGSDA